MSGNPHPHPGIPPAGPGEGIGMGGGYVAGTLVHTSTGLVPIQDVQVGDLVQVRPHVTSEKAFRRVIGRSVRADRTIEKLTFVSDDDSLSEHHVYVNGNQPFWVVDAGWTPARQLRLEAAVRLADGSQAELLARSPVWRTDSPNVGWTRDPFEEAGRDIDFTSMEVVGERDFDEGLLANEAASPYFRGTVFGLQIEELHAFHVTRLGVWVHDMDCGAR